MLRRVPTFLIGLFFVALGVCLSVKADLGVSPISLVPYIYSLITPLTLGMWTVLVNLLMVIAQKVLLKDQFKAKHLLQLPTMVLFGVFIDVILYCLAGFEIVGLTSQLLWCIAGTIALAFGIFLEIKSVISYMPGEGLVLAIAKVFMYPFGRVKVAVDASLVLFGAISSLLFFFEVQGAGIGTLIAVVFVGIFVGWFDKLFPRFGAWVLAKN